ncbi:hypothetical protein [Rhodobacter sp. 24-YEA-8]|uniref:hypothetical protein n=1 Tax=Rhodobacter sp. 24-YEA-8 TaxID=1884310 RepID=UPI0008947B48|nr:hypothetical protein [Rhodobacter sp. 24-YEA-8]SEB78741.1 hypothetical protein SAMN05519105_1308 [Rhodobacter sp. 24-YEA-8]
MNRAYSSWDAFAAELREAMGFDLRSAAGEARRHEATKIQRMRRLERPGDVPGALVEGRCEDVTEGGRL